MLEYKLGDGLTDRTYFLGQPVWDILEGVMRFRGAGKTAFLPVERLGAATLSRVKEKESA